MYSHFVARIWAGAPVEQSLPQEEDKSPILQHMLTQNHLLPFYSIGPFFVAELEQSTHRNLRSIAPQKPVCT